MLNTLWISSRWAIISIVIGLIATNVFLSDLFWDNQLFHVLLESTGALMGFGLATILAAMIQKHQLPANYVWLIACFVSMGTLDMLHSQQEPGNIFVWLHSTATLIGGTFSMLIWLPNNFSEKFLKPAYFWFVLALSILFCIVSIYNPENTLPMLTDNHQFTWNARFLNFFGSLGFILTWLYFVREYHRLHRTGSFFFSNNFFLFGVAALVFELSALWDGNWWFWHIIRVFAYIFLMLHFGIAYRQSLLKSLKESENRYRSLVEASPDWIWEVNEHGVYTYSSPKIFELLGYKPEEVIGKTPFDFMTPEDAHNVGAEFSEIAANKRPFNNLVNSNIHKNGQIHILETSGIPILDEQGNLRGYRGIDRDITQRHLNEIELKLERDFNNTIFESAGNVIVVMDLQGYFIRFNRAAEILTGYSRDEVFRKKTWETVIPDEQIERVKNVFNNLRDGKVNIAGEYENEWKTSIGTRRLLHWYNSVLRDANGTITHIMAMGYDITEKKELEKERIRMQNELQQAQKMESLGHLTGGIAHDFNNLLGIICGYSSLVYDACIDKKEERLANHMRHIMKAGERAANLVTQMLSFSRSDDSGSSNLQLAPIVNESIQMLRASLPSTIEISLYIEPDLPCILINPTHVHQILMNLLINARDAMDETGTLSIRLGWMRNLNTISPVSHKPVDGDWIAMSISDTGCGIDASIINKIFDPFFTTKEVGKGTGMGLAVIYRIVNNHHGHILLDSNPDKGSTFHILFPPQFNITANQDSPVNTVNIPQGKNTEILFVDDEPLLGKYMCDVLSINGYKPTYVEDSSEALELFTKNPDRFYLLITDQTMPKISGSELIAKIRGIKPDLPVILYTGYSAKINSESAAKLNISYFEKPVNINKMLTKIAELLNITQ